MTTAEAERSRLVWIYIENGATPEEAEILADREIAYRERMAELTNAVNRLEKIKIRSA